MSQLSERVIWEAVSRVEIAELLSVYGYLLDDRDWPGLDRVFTDDVVADWSALGLEVYDGLDALRAGFAAMRHPVAHHVSNVVVEFGDSTDAASAVSKWIAPRADGTLGRSGEYRDELVRTPAGWRIKRRSVALRAKRPDSI